MRRASLTPGQRSYVEGTTEEEDGRAFNYAVSSPSLFPKLYRLCPNRTAPKSDFFKIDLLESPPFDF